ncbi:unnamed protein product [Auanema sp. JU1783]|nr:unnamed protein product [Auanema sp. JU1783]
MRSITLFVLSIVIGSAFACKCLPLKPNDAYCKADWVSHVKIRLRSTKQPNSSDPNRPGLNHIKYDVEHVKVFKKPNDVQTLPTQIFTPSESAACGLILDTGNEYLLAGRMNNGSLTTVICGQVLPEQPVENASGVVLQWSQVPKDLAQAIPNFKC